MVQWSGFARWTAGRPLSAKDRKALTGWSSDLLLHLALTLEQSLVPACPKLPLRRLVETLKEAYLAPLGAGALKGAEQDLAFRFFLATQEDTLSLRKKAAPLKGNATARAKAVYGWATLWRGVALVGSAPVDLGPLEKVLERLCPKGVCAYWNPRTLYKVIVTDHGGLAAYIPETATLVLSRGLFTSSAAVDRLVLTHELTHGAVRGAQLNGLDWSRDFAPFSGWGVPGVQPKEAGVWSDVLARTPSQAGFSLEPDPVIPSLTTEDATFEGFPLGRTYSRVIASEDVAEDLADSVGAALWAPERFCWKGQPLAPKKWQWVWTTALARPAPALKCAP